MRERQRRICKDLRPTESNAHFRNTNRESSYSSVLWQITLDLLKMLNDNNSFSLLHNLETGNLFEI